MKKLRTPPGRLHQLKPRTPTGRLASLLPTTTTPQSTHIIHHIPNSFFLTFQFPFPIDRIASRDIPHFSGAVTPPSSPVCSAKLHQTVPHISHSQLQFYYIRIPVSHQIVPRRPWGWGHVHVLSSSCSCANARSSIGVRWSSRVAQNARVFNVINRSLSVYC